MTSDIYSLVVVMVLLTTVMTPLLLRYCPGMTVAESGAAGPEPVLTDISIGSQHAERSL